MEDIDDQATSAVDAVRCLYLARMAKEKGHNEAARRWEDRANRWLRACEAAPGEGGQARRLDEPGE